jgi:hypothetical protein
MASESDDAIARGLEMQARLPKPWRPRRPGRRRADDDGLETAGGLVDAAVTLGPAGLVLGVVGLVAGLIGRRRRRSTP